MFNAPKIKTLLQPPKRYYALTVVIDEASEFVIHGLLIRDEPNGDFYIEERFATYSFADVKSRCNTNYPILINFEGATIVSKRTTYQDGYLKTVLFRANMDDFYIYETVQDTDVYISYTRKSNLDTVLDAFAKADFHSIRFTLGPFILSRSIPYLDTDTRQIYASTYDIETNGQYITDFKKTEETTSRKIQALKESFTAYELPALCVFLEEKIKTPLLAGSEEQAQYNRQEVRYKQLFKRGGVAVLTIIICSLILGHLIKKSKTKTLLTKQSEITFLQQSQNTINQLTEEKSNKEYILANSGFSKNGVFTEYISTITNSVPSEIILNTLDIQPLAQKIKPDEKITFDFNSITIEGLSTSDKAFDTWIDLLRKIPWIKRLEVIDYKIDRIKNDVFEISIELS